MDDMMREALACKDIATIIGIESVKDDWDGEILNIARAALAILSSPAEEAQDGESARDMVKHIVSIVLPNQITALRSGDIDRAVSLIQAYAASHARPMPDLTADIEEVKGTLLGFVTADYKTWDEGFNNLTSFHDWVQSRARHSLDALDRIEAAIKEARDDE